MSIVEKKPLTKVYIDFETRSRADLRNVGSWKYATDPSTEIMCMAWAIGDKAIHLWKPGGYNPELLFSEIEKGVEFHAHNAQFERMIWQHILVPQFKWPKIPFEAWRCTAAKTAYANRPRALKGATKVLLPENDGKDDAGHKLMLKMCKPNKKGEWFDTSGAREQLYEYCKQDVEAERKLDAVLPDWPESEIKIWQVNERVNDRGVPFDRELCESAVAVLKDKLEQVESELDIITKGVITTGSQVARIKKFVQERGVNIPDLSASSVATALENELPSEVRQVLELRQLSAGAAAKKYESATQVMDDDSRGRGLFIYYGASQTGRFAGTKTQIQNMKKGSDITGVFRDAVLSQNMETLECLYSGTLITELGKNVRSMVCAGKGSTLLRCDSSQIECRVVHWLAGNDKMLETFRQGHDPYIEFASNVFNRTIQKGDAERQIGKAAILGLGYGMGATRFRAQVKDMAGVEITEAFAKHVVDLYRKSNRSITQLWYNLDKAAKLCCTTYAPARVGKIEFRMEGTTLVLILPSQRKLYYPEAYFKGEGRDDRFYYTSPRGLRCEWAGGLLVENTTQAVARDTLTHYMLQADSLGLDIVAHVHDELIIECKEDEADRKSQVLSSCFANSPSWADGLPTASEVTIGARYA